MLIKRRDGERRSEPDRACIRRQDSGQHVDQRGLAAAVWADDADTVAALDADREIADDRTAIVALADAGGLDDQRAGRRRRTGGDDGVPGGAAIAAALFPKRLQLADATHIALASAGDAVAHPVFLGDDFAIELVLIAFLLRQHRIAPFFEMGKSTIEAARLAAVEPDRAAREHRKKAPVVADDHQRGASGIEIALQPFDRGQVEMIGRLVEKQNIGVGRQHTRERRAARFAAREFCRIFLPGEAELLQETTGGMAVVVRPQAGLDIGKRGREPRKIRLLRQVAHHGPGLNENGTAVRFDEPRRDFQQGRFAGAVTSDQRYALTRTDR